MPYLITATEKDQCVCLSYTGDTPLTQMLAARREANALLEAKRWRRILVDVTEWLSVPSARELFEFAQKLPAGLSVRPRVALVVRQDQTKHARLLEQIIRKSGIFLAYFVDLERARAWIRGAARQANESSGQRVH